jgi:hypothetical protein
MAIRIAATSALALAAALLVTPAAHAQQFFSFFEMSPGQIAGMLNDDGYQLSGPLMRRGNVYVCDVVSVTGRPARLIVDARDGHVLERFAAVPHRRRLADAPAALRPPRDIGDEDASGSGDEDASRSDDDEDSGRRQTAMGGSFNAPSRVYGSDALFGWKPTPAPTPEAASHPKPRHHASRKHKEPAVAKSSGVAPTASADAKSSDKPSDASSSVAAVAPSAGVTPIKPDAAPKSESKSESKPEAKPAPEREQAKADPDIRPVVAAPAPKPAASHKKLNDLPVGTLD